MNFSAHSPQTPAKRSKFPPNRKISPSPAQIAKSAPFVAHICANHTARAPNCGPYRPLSKNGPCVVAAISAAGPQIASPLPQRLTRQLIRKFAPLACEKRDTRPSPKDARGCTLIVADPHASCRIRLNHCASLRIAAHRRGCDRIRPESTASGTVRHRPAPSGTVRTSSRRGDR